MKLTFLIALFGVIQAYASTAPVNLMEGKPHSAYTHISAYIYTPGLNFNQNEADPTRLKIACGAHIYEVGDTYPSGKPKWVQVASSGLTIYTFICAEDDSEVLSRKKRGRQWKLVFLDEDEKPTTGKPTYYHITDTKEVQYRVHATKGESHILGHPIFIISKDGKKHDFEKSGFEIILDNTGYVHQFKDSKSICLISYPDDKTRVYDKYDLTQLEPEKRDGQYVLQPGSMPYEKVRLHHPEPDDMRYMVSEEYQDGKLQNIITWTRGDNPFVFKFVQKKTGQEIPFHDDHYYRNEDDALTLHRKKYSKNGADQFEKIAIYLKNKGYSNTYVRQVDDGEETINAYKYIEDFSSGEFIQVPTLHQPAEGTWFRKQYDDVGRLTMEWVPVEEVIKEEARDPALKDLISLFPDPSEESIQKHQEIRFIPEKAPGDPELARTTGVVEYFSYESLSSDDKVTLEDDRPRFLFKLKQGELVHRKWRVYGTRENGNTYFLEEETDDPEGVFGDESHQRTLTDTFAETHPVAPGKKSAVSYPDGSIDVFYYNMGHWNPENKFFDVHPEGESLRTEITHGILKEGVWSAGTTTRTKITDPREKILFEQGRELQTDGSWKTL